MDKETRRELAKTLLHSTDQGGEDGLKSRAARALGIAGLLGGVIAAYGLGLLLPVDMAIRRQFALAFAPEPDPRVVTVEIDDASISALGRWPWPRSLLARLVSEVSERNPAAIGVDIMLSEPEANTGNDTALADAIARSGRVVIPAYVQSYSLPPHVQWYVSQKRPLLPIVELEQAARGLGHVSAIRDPDGAVRRVPAVIGVPDGFVPAFAAEVVRVGVEAGTRPSTLGGGLNFRPGAQAAVGEYRIPLDSTSSMSPVFPWPPAAERISAARLLAKAPSDASADDRSPDADSSRRLPDLAGKFVLIGVTAAGIGDSHETPLLARYGANGTRGGSQRHSHWTFRASCARRSGFARSCVFRSASRGGERGDQRQGSRRRRCRAGARGRWSLDASRICMAVCAQTGVDGTKRACACVNATARSGAVLPRRPAQGGAEEIRRGRFPGGGRHGGSGRSAGYGSDVCGPARLDCRLLPPGTGGCGTTCQ